MATECPPCSRIGTERSNPQGEARLDELMSRNASELDSASLDYMGMAKPPIRPKPAIRGEEVYKRIHGIPRSVWRQRAGKEPHRNLGDPLARGGGGKSEDLIVVKKRRNGRGAKEVCCL